MERKLRLVARAFLSLGPKSRRPEAKSDGPSSHLTGAVGHGAQNFCGNCILILLLVY